MVCSFVRARFSNKLKLNVNTTVKETNRQQLSMVYTLIDYRNNVKIITILQRNHSLAAAWWLLWWIHLSFEHCDVISKKRKPLKVILSNYSKKLILNAKRQLEATKVTTINVDTKE